MCTSLQTLTSFIWGKKPGNSSFNNNPKSRGILLLLFLEELNITYEPIFLHDTALISKCPFCPSAAEQSREDSGADKQGPRLALLPPPGPVDSVPGGGNAPPRGHSLPDSGTSHAEGNVEKINASSVTVTS